MVRYIKLIRQAWVGGGSDTDPPTIEYFRIDDFSGRAFSYNDWCKKWVRVCDSRNWDVWDGDRIVSVTESEVVKSLGIETKS